MRLMLDNYTVLVESPLENSNETKERCYIRGKRKKDTENRLSMEYVHAVTAKKSSIDSGYATLTNNRIKYNMANKGAYSKPNSDESLKRSAKKYSSSRDLNASMNGRDLNASMRSRDLKNAINRDIHVSSRNMRNGRDTRREPAHNKYSCVMNQTQLPPVTTAAMFTVEQVNQRRERVKTSRGDRRSISDPAVDPVFSMKKVAIEGERRYRVKTSRGDRRKISDPAADPVFSVKKVEPVGERRERLKTARGERRKFSDDHDMRRQALHSNHTKLSSVSLETFDKNNVFCCVRDSNELLHVKQASSSSRPVERLEGQSAKLRHSIQHPKSYKHPVPVPAAILKNNDNSPRKPSYVSMYAARKQLLDQQNELRRKQENINKQCVDNRARRERNAVVTGAPVRPSRPITAKHGSYPHTLPSAMYDQPHPADFPALYDTVPVIPPIPLYSSIKTDLDDSDSLRRSMGHTEYSNMTALSHHVTSTRAQSRAQSRSSPAPPLSSSVVDVTQGSYAAQKKPITYKPYTYEEFKGLKSTFGNKVGGLGPDTENSIYKTKQLKATRMQEYANMIRAQHQMTEFPKRKAARPGYEAPSKTDIAHGYAKSICLPREGRGPRPRPEVEESETLYHNLKRQHRLIIRDLHRM